MGKKKFKKSSSFQTKSTTKSSSSSAERSSTVAAKPQAHPSPPARQLTQAQATQSELFKIQPEQMSLTAYQHIQNYLTSENKSFMSKEDLNVVLRLSQHLRVFGLLSAVGYVNQSNAQGGKVRERTLPVWGSLLGQLMGKPIDNKSAEYCRDLMETVAEMAQDRPVEYMATWRKSLQLAEQWNFWARAYAEGE